MNANLQICMHCGNPLKGRIDKKYCNDFCRNSYNNQQNSAQNNHIRNLNNILRKNRRILLSCIPQDEETAKVKKSKLIDSGFNFNYFTNNYQTQKGQIYIFIYEYGYLHLNEDWILVVKRKIA